MKRAALAVLLFLAVSMRGYAGHAFMNSFADIEWLPEPGYTPNDFLYPVDTLVEKILLAIASIRGDEMARSLEFAREKLAETGAMLKAHNSAAAELAADRYREYIERAAAAIARAPAEQRTEERRACMNALLEHVYIMSVDYVDMPLDVRAAVLTPLFDHAMAQFHALRAGLSEAEQKAFFFKEEEIRWSLEMATQADAQRITNE